MKKSITIILSSLLIYSQCFAETNSYYIDDSQFTKELESAPALFIPKKIDKYGVVELNSSNTIVKTDELNFKDNYSHLNSKDMVFLGSILLLLNPEIFIPLKSIEEVILVISFVVGTAVILGFIVDGIWIASQLIDNDYSHLKKWIDIGTTISYFSYSKNESDINRHAIYGGLMVSVGLKHKDSGIGLTSEIGHIDLSLADKSTRDNKTYGFYGMIGPTVKLLFRKGGVIHFDCMVGGSDLKEIEMMGVFRIGLNYPLSEHTFLDFNYGVHYLENREIDGYIEDSKLTKNYNSLFGFQVGYRF